MKTIIAISLNVLMCVFLAASLARAQEVMVYHQLAMRDLDEVSLYVREQIKLSREGHESRLDVLKRAVFTVFSRPDEDGMIDKVVGPLRSEIDEHATWEQVFRELVPESTSTLNDPKSLSGAMQVTHAVFLQNVISHVKPKARPGTWERDVLQVIADAKIRLSKASRDERKLRVMKDVQSPSAMAEQALRQRRDKGPESLDGD